MQLTQEQFQQLLIVLRQIADKQFTITQAADWPMLVAMGGMLAVLLGCMWMDLRGRFTANDREHDKLWQSQSDCQADCCSRGKDTGHRRRFDDDQGGFAIVRLLITMTVTIILIFSANAAWQHYHCGTPWRRCNPVQVVGCDRIEDLMVEMEELKKLAGETR